MDLRNSILAREPIRIPQDPMRQWKTLVKTADRAVEDFLDDPMYMDMGPSLHLRTGKSLNTLLDDFVMLYEINVQGLARTGNDDFPPYREAQSNVIRIVNPTDTTLLVTDALPTDIQITGPSRATRSGVAAVAGTSSHGASAHSSPSRRASRVPTFRTPPRQQQQPMQDVSNAMQVLVLSILTNSSSSHSVSPLRVVGGPPLPALPDEPSHPEQPNSTSGAVMVPQQSQNHEHGSEPCCVIL